MKRLLVFALLVASYGSLGSCANPEHREAMDYLVVNMPAGDRDTLSVSYLKSNVDWALRARHEFPWAAALPDSIFLNEVLPYAVVDEPREDWREKFYGIFAPKVQGATTIQDAIRLVNKHINKAVGVEYNTLRKRTNQAPSESMEQGMASCTGLSIILVDAFRSVGIPARFAGTAAWHDDRGNHSWVEVWVDGKWWFTEFYPDADGLDNAWFLADAGQGNPVDREYAVWAVSWKPTGEAFPMVWSPESNDVHGVNVTDQYISRYKKVTDNNAKAGTHVPVRFTTWKAEVADVNPADRNSADRVATNVDVFAGDRQMGGGRTSGPTADMNNALIFSLPKNAEYIFRWWDDAGQMHEKTVAVSDQPVEAEGFIAQ